LRFTLYALRFKLCDDAPAFCEHGDGGCNCSDDDSCDDSVWVHEHDNNHGDDAWVVSADGAHHDVVATEAGAAG